MELDNRWQPYLALAAASSATALVPTVLVTLFFASLPGLIEYFSRISELSDLMQAVGKPEYIKNSVEVFDYIIIGAGSAGAVVANRLSADGTRSILVLEGGGDPNPFTTVPAFAGPSARANAIQPSTDYDYRVVKQERACLAAQQFTRGRGLGGTSNLNAMNYVRGNPNDFDEWARASADPVWAYESVLEMFMKSEDYHGSYEPGDSRYHSQGGELYVGRNTPDAALNYMFDAFRELDFQHYDMNSNHQQGYGFLDQNIRAGRRWGTYKAFIEPALNRSNLSIYRYARAMKIHFNKGLRTTGVTYFRHGAKRFVRARKEVLLCAGSIDSPRLLMLSGIGPKEHLESVGISRVLVDLPVGQGLEDHLGVQVSISINESLSYAPERDTTFDDISNYLRFGAGPLGRLFYTSVGLGYITSTETNNRQWPDLELLFNGAVSNDSSGVYTDTLGCIVWLMRPKSNGFLRLASNDPNERPIIDPNYLSHPSDIDRMLEGIQFILELFSTKVLKRLRPQLSPNTQVPGCEQFEFLTRQYWECYARQMSITLCHPVGTCRMGKGIGDPRAVVDSRLRVLNTKGLRVIDSSIMPNIPTGHTNAPTIMIGEMGSSFILRGE